MKEHEHEPDYFDLDKGRLDEEWLQQPKLYRRAAERLAGARAEYERSKARRDIIEADLQLRIKKDPEEYGLPDKPDVATVKAAVASNPKLEKAEMEVIQQHHTVGLLEAEVTALEHRKRALEKLVDLFLSGYWAEPRVRTPEARERMKQVERNAAFGKGKKVPSHTEGD